MITSYKPQVSFFLINFPCSLIKKMYNYRGILSVILYQRAPLLSISLLSMAPLLSTSYLAQIKLVYANKTSFAILHRNSTRESYKLQEHLYILEKSIDKKKLNRSRSKYCSISNKCWNSRTIYWARNRVWLCWYTHKTSGFKTSGFKMPGFKTSGF